MIKDIIVTTPQSDWYSSAEEAKRCIGKGGGEYFRYFRNRPKHLFCNSKLFYTQGSYVRGFCVVSDIRDEKEGNVCSTTGRYYRGGCYAYMDAKSWKWIRPIPYPSFQGFRYFDMPWEVIGGWKDPYPVFKMM